ncbi:MAG TPA: hypothetical protein VHP56_06320 [Solirubrobacterales bacterium]|nr:hypothetical protein [Solirubrobacterales bacterium]
MAERDPDRLSRNAALVLLAVAMAAAAAVLIDYGHSLTYFQDSWEFLMHRRDPSAATLLEPHNEHIVLVPVLIEQAMLRLFGMESMTPELVLLIALLLATAALVFVYARRRLGSWPALFAAVLLLFLGPAWQDLLWPFQVGFAGSSMFGMAMLLALESDEERWDRAACAFLALAIAFSSLGIAFAVAAAVDVLRRRRSRGLRRAYVFGLPLALYAGWYLGWGHDAENNFSAHNVLVSPRYVWEGLTASLDSVLALGTIFGEVVGRSKWAAPLLIALLALAAYGGWRRRGFFAGLWPVLAAAATFWFLAAFNFGPGREPYSSRYLYVGGLFAVLIAVNLLQGAKFNRWALVAGAAATAVIVGFNLVPLREGRDFFAKQTVLTRSDLAAIEIASRTVEPPFRLSPEVAGTAYLNEIEAGEYLQAVDEYGSPAYSPAALAAAPEEGREQADLVLANALPLGIETGLPPSPASGHCIRLSGDNPGRDLPLRPGTTTIHFRSSGEASVQLRRFASGEYPLRSLDIAGNSTTKLFIPRDRSQRPWRLRAESPQGATVCSR